ncbi:SagB/ThcOx family dehydrogenase [Nannocystis punicea]|uniref:SagB/ThcOx family dehydrogenase n=1 Tax=Nannocystis punicea TaxID=2995304 RepID=A0ABY7HAT0_9BACT|nr:SagB/ThcOx family dehydrogenase [Nannocystis poenicansa]WAS96212.1 SagB/ThcOx family dehydrogenase [Nannocystis poenicansa]
MPSDLERVLDYHERTAHRPGRYAASLGYLDWDTQPNPFRLYDGAERFALPRVHPRLVDHGPTWADLFRGTGPVPAALDTDLLGSLCFHAFALSAWKQAGASRWSLRVNPSSGNLHPTEVYLLAGPQGGLSEEPGLYHYTPLLHGLERRAALDPRAWQALGFPGLLVGLSSIAWREAWKYGERAFRYCNHDVGHAVAALAFAAALHGWRAVLVDPLPDRELAALLGLGDLGRGVEAEHPECLVALLPGDAPPRLDAPAVLRLAPTALEGQPNQLSEGHHEWPILPEIAAATATAAATTVGASAATVSAAAATESAVAATVSAAAAPRPWPPPAAPRACDLDIPAAPLLRRRRSAVAMDGRTGITAPAFYDMLLQTLPGGLPTAALPWRPAVDLALMVHRVQGVDPGLYLLVREPGRVARWRAALPEASWQAPPECPAELPLVALRAGDVRREAALVSCAQDIAADGAFAVAMFVDLRAELEREGPAHYRRLYWETGAIGQLLYLAAEALGIAATGIGCFFDQPTRHLLGLPEHDGLRSLYHFTVGGRVDDPRLRTLDAYHHLDRP